MLLKSLFIGIMLLSIVYPSVAMENQSSYADKTKECQTCGDWVAFPTYMRHHVNKVHKDLLPFICYRCGICITENMAIAEHEKECLNKPRFRCPVCCKGYDQKPFFEEHKKNCLASHNHNQLTVHERLTTHERSEASSPSKRRKLGLAYTEIENPIRDEQLIQMTAMIAWNFFQQEAEKAINDFQKSITFIKGSSLVNAAIFKVLKEQRQADALYAEGLKGIELL